MDPSAALLLALHDARRTLRSARAVALFAIFVGSFLLSGLGFVMAVESATRGLLASAPPGTDPREVAEQAKQQLFRGLVSDPTWADGLVGTPSVVLFFFAASLAFLPALACLTSFDAVAPEVQSRSVRHTLLRCDRTTYVAGKLAGQALLLAALITAVGVVLLAAAAVRIPGFDAIGALPSLLRYDLLAILYGSVFVALAVLCSVVARSPRMALLLSFCGLFAAGFLWLLGASQTLGFLSLLSPFRHGLRFFAPDLAGLAAAVGIYLAFLAALVAAAVGAMHARDV